jgi:hypothetical protein
MDKKPLDSKKFLCFFFSMVMISGIMIAALALQPITWPMALFMAAGMIADGALAIGYVISQKSLDMFLATMSDIGKQVQKKTEEEIETDA